MKRLIEKLKVGLGAGLVLLLGIGFAVETTGTMPDNAEVMVDDRARLYHSPMFFYDTEEPGWEGLRLTTAGEARKRGYEAAEASREGGYFVDDRGALLWSWLEEAGLPRRRERWNPDGSWNW